MNRIKTTRRLMAISHAEFLHSLEPLARHYPYRIEESGRRIILTDDERQIEIRLGQEGVRRLGALELPETLVEFRFQQDEPEAVERFFFHFGLCFHRGGG